MSYVYHMSHSAARIAQRTCHTLSHRVDNAILCIIYKCVCVFRNNALSIGIQLRGIYKCVWDTEIGYLQRIYWVAREGYLQRTGGLQKRGIYNV